MRHLRLILALAPLILLTAGCAHKVPLSTQDPAKGIKTLRAAAVVEFTNKSTEKGRALITISSPDLFRIEIKGPIGITTALITGSKDSITLLYRGESTTYTPGENKSLPLNIRAAELVSLLLGSRDFPPRDNKGFETQALPRGRVITRRINNHLLYRATMSDYKTISGVHLPYTISVEGEDYKLLVKYTKVNVNPEINNSYFKTTR